MRTVAAALILLSLVSSLKAQRGPEISVELDRDQVYQGESVGYRITLNNVENPSRPELGKIDNCQVEFQGEQALNESQIIVRNGQMTRLDRHGMTYQYRLTPLAQGILSIPAPTAKVDGKVLKGRRLTLRVVGPTKQDIVSLELSADRKRVYPLLPFSITLKVIVKALPAPYADQSPFSVQGDPPVLSLPWVDSIPDGLVPATGWREWLGPIENPGSLLANQDGLAINKIASFFAELSVFNPPHKRVTRRDAKGIERGYWEYTLSRSFHAEKTGIFRFGPVSLKGTFGTRIDARGRGLLGTKIYALADTISVTVEDAPLKGRPPEYTGAVGVFELKAEVSPTKASVGDPMTLTVKLTGNGTLDLAQPPDLQAVAEIRDNFKVYEATVETKGKTRLFTWGLRPENAKISQLPPIPLAYFDVDRERYVTLKTEKIPLEITESEKLASEDIVTAGQGSKPSSRAVQRYEKGLFANVTDPAAFRNQRPWTDPRLAIGVIASMLAIYLLARMLKGLHGRLTSDPAASRRRTAAKRARANLEQGLSLWRSGDLRAGTEGVRACLTGLVADVADLPSGGLASGDVRRQLEDLGVEASVVERALGILESCDAMRFGVQEASADHWGPECRKVLSSLIDSLAKKGRLRR